MTQYTLTESLPISTSLTEFYDKQRDSSQKTTNQEKDMSQSYLKVTEWQVTAINPDNYLRKTRPKRPKKAKNFENYQSTNIVEKSMKKYSTSFDIYLYKLQQYSNSSAVKKRMDYNHLEDTIVDEITVESLKSPILSSSINRSTALSLL